jgi:hypothetical protein
MLSGGSNKEASCQLPDVAKNITQTHNKADRELILKMNPGVGQQMVLCFLGGNRPALRLWLQADRR